MQNNNEYVHLPKHSDIHVGVITVKCAKSCMRIPMEAQYFFPVKKHHVIFDKQDNIILYSLSAGRHNSFVFLSMITVMLMR